MSPTQLHSNTKLPETPTASNPNSSMTTFSHRLGTSTPASSQVFLGSSSPSSFRPSSSGMLDSNSSTMGGKFRSETVGGDDSYQVPPNPFPFSPSELSSKENSQPALRSITTYSPPKRNFNSSLAASTFSLEGFREENRTLGGPGLSSVAPFHSKTQETSSWEREKELEGVNHSQVISTSPKKSGFQSPLKKKPRLEISDRLPRPSLLRPLLLKSSHNLLIFLFLNLNSLNHHLRNYLHLLPK